MKKTLLYSAISLLLLFSAGFFAGCSKTPLDVLEKKVLRNPDSAEAHNNLAFHLTELKRYQEAVDEYDKSLELRPGDFLAANNKGYVLFLMERYKEAIEVFDELIEADPSKGGVHANLAMCYHNLEQYDKAKESYEKALSLSPKHKFALQGYAALKEDMAAAAKKKAEEAEGKQSE